MAKGDRENFKADIDDGFTKIANLLLEALAAAKLNGVQKGICLFLWRRTYGWGVKEDQVGLKEFAQACDTSEQYISRQLKQLVSWNIIIRTSYAPGKVPTYTYNTRVTEWNKGCINVQGLNDCAIQGLYKCAIQGLHDCARVNQSPDQESQGLEPCLKTGLKKDQINSSSSLTTTEQSPKASLEKTPTNKALIAELTLNYREIAGIIPVDADFAFIGNLYNKHGYQDVLLGIDKLQKTMNSGQEIKKPLVYMAGILKNMKEEQELSNAKARASPKKEVDNFDWFDVDKFNQKLSSL